MTISIYIRLLRPEDLCGLKNNLRVLAVLAEKLDGVCVRTSVALDDSGYREVGLMAQFYWPDDPVEEPMLYEEDAFEWAIEKFTKDFDWEVSKATLDRFWPDEPGCSEKEAKAMRNLGVRPFTE